MYICIYKINLNNGKKLRQIKSYPFTSIAKSNRNQSSLNNINCVEKSE